jgi:hypothetical protein
MKLRALVFGLLVAAFSTGTTLAQDWARAQLEKSPRHHEWVDLKHGDRTVRTFVVYPEVKTKLTDRLIEIGMGSRKTNYKLRDWVFSRQRYWGEPIPIYFPVDMADAKGDPRRGDAHTIRYAEPIPVAESELPVVLPDLEDFNLMLLEEIDKKVDPQKMEETLMHEGLAKFADPQKALIKLIGEKRAALK